MQNNYTKRILEIFILTNVHHPTKQGTRIKFEFLS